MHTSSGTFDDSTVYRGGIHLCPCGGHSAWWQLNDEPATWDDEHADGCAWMVERRAPIRDVVFLGLDGRPVEPDADGMITIAVPAPLALRSSP